MVWRFLQSGPRISNVLQIRLGRKEDSIHTALKLRTPAARPSTMEFDFIMGGAGSAGCVLANRLTACGRYRVLLLEAGGADRRLSLRVPIGYGRSFYDPSVNWMYKTEPDPGLGGREGYWPRGKVLGGSSAINAMVFIRGQPADFDGWA